MLVQLVDLVQVYSTQWMLAAQQDRSCLPSRVVSAVSVARRRVKLTTHLRIIHQTADIAPDGGKTIQPPADGRFNPFL